MNILTLPPRAHLLPPRLTIPEHDHLCSDTASWSGNTIFEPQRDFEDESCISCERNCTCEVIHPHISTLLDYEKQSTLGSKRKRSDHFFDKPRLFSMASDRPRRSREPAPDSEYLLSYTFVLGVTDAYPRTNDLCAQL